MSRKLYLVSSGCIFGMVACLHALRLIFAVQIQVGGWVFPLWFSWFGLPGATAWCTWAFYEVRKA